MMLKTIAMAAMCALLAACNSAPQSATLRPDVLYFEDGPKAREAAAEITRLYGGRQEVVIVSERIPPLMPPVPRMRKPPIYPMELMRAGVTGRVLVDAIIGETGDVLYTALVKSTDARFNAPALEAVQKWRFNPAHRGSQPVRCRLLIPVAFTLM